MLSQGGRSELELSQDSTNSKLRVFYYSPSLLIKHYNLNGYKRQIWRSESKIYYQSMKQLWLEIECILYLILKMII